MERSEAREESPRRRRLGRLERRLRRGEALEHGVNLRRRVARRSFLSGRYVPAIRHVDVQAILDFDLVTRFRAKVLERLASQLAFRSHEVRLQPLLHPPDVAISAVECRVGSLLRLDHAIPRSLTSVEHRVERCDLVRHLIPQHGGGLVRGAGVGRRVRRRRRAGVEGERGEQRGALLQARGRVRAERAADLAQLLQPVERGEECRDVSLVVPVDGYARAECARACACVWWRWRRRRRR